MGVFGVTCLSVLVVVTAIDDKDALSTVALALAILAFTIQLIVFVAQQSLAAEQGRRNEELHGAMQGLLAEIREKAAGTQADVRTINERMLGAILSKNLASASGGQVDYGTLASQLAQAAMQEGDGEGAGPASLRPADFWPERRPSPEDRGFIQTLQTFPAEDELEDELEVLQRLSPRDRQSLKAFGDDEVIARGPGSPFDPSLTVAAVGGLGEAGLVEPYPPERQPADEPVIFRLTEPGRRVARLLTAPGEPPPHLQGLREIRDATPDRLPWQTRWRSEQQG